MRKTITTSLFLILLMPALLLGQEAKISWTSGDEPGLDNMDVIWSSEAPSNAIGAASFAWTSSASSAFPDSINQIKNVKAGADLDGDGHLEFMSPVVHVVDGVSKRSIFVFENNGDDVYELVWGYTFPGAADQFTTVDVSDLDGDGVQEILAVNVRAEGDDDAGPNIYVFESQGDDDYGTEPTVTWDLGSAGRDVVRVAKAADLDGDGKQELVATSFLTQPAIVVASVSDFDLPVWTTEFVNNDIGGTAPDIAAIGIGDMDGDGTPEVVLTEGATNSLVLLEASAADTYEQVVAAFPLEGKSVSVHGIETGDANGDGFGESYIANLQGAVWVATTLDVSTFTSDDIYLIADTEEQWLETGFGSLTPVMAGKTANAGVDFVIAASNASTAHDFQYIGGPGGDPTDADQYSSTVIVTEEDFLTVIPGGMRVYGLDLGGDLDGDGYPEVVFSRGSTRGGANAPALFVLESKPAFATAPALPDSINQIKNVKAGADLDGDGKLEFMSPVVHLVDGVAQRSIVVYENTDDNEYELAWSYTFPGVADQFTTVDVSDLDGDGALEILAVNVRAEGDDDEGPNIYVFENVGDNDYGTEPTVTWDLGSAGRDVVRVAKAMDLDGDGKQEVVATSFLTQPAIVIASVSDFDLPVWTTEYVNNDIGGTAPDIAAIGIGDLDGDSTPEVILTEGATNSLVLLEASATDTYEIVVAAFPLEGKSVSVHGIETGDANGDGFGEAYIANLQGAVWVAATQDVSTFTSDDIYLIADTEEQWLETGFGSLTPVMAGKTANAGVDFVIAASNASTAHDYQYIGGPGGDPTDADQYASSTIITEDDFANLVPGGMRVYGLDLGGDLDGDGYPEVVFSRGSTRGGANAPALFIAESVPRFALAPSLPDSINQIKNVKAGIDLDGDGAMEFMSPVVHLVDGVAQRSIVVYENTADDEYALAWSYTFPGVADQFTTVDVSDLDGDGALEILAVNVRAEGDDDEGPNIYVFETVGDNDYGTEPTVTWDLGSAGRDVVRVAKAMDLDGDGKQEVVATSFLTQPAIVVASVSDFDLPVWTTEYVNNDIGGTAPDIAAIGIGDMDGDGTPEVVLTEGATNSLVLIEATAADTYEQFVAAFPLEGKSISVHGIETGDANGDGFGESYIANLQGAVWVVATQDVSTFTSDDIYLIADTEEQWLETGFGSLSGGVAGKSADGGSCCDFVIAASNASTAWDYQYIGGPGGDPTDADQYSATEVIGVDDFVNVVPGGMRVYGLDLGGDMDGDGVGEIVFSRGSTRGGANAPALFVLEIEAPFSPPTVAVDLDELPDGFALGQNYPNPFNPTTSITFSLAEPGYVNLSVYNQLGQQVVQLVNGVRTADTHIVDWNALSDSGQHLPSGIYIYRIEVNGKAKSRSMVLLK